MMHLPACRWHSCRGSWLQLARSCSSISSGLAAVQGCSSSCRRLCSEQRCAAEHQLHHMAAKLQQPCLLICVLLLHAHITCLASSNHAAHIINIIILMMMMTSAA
jgi:hypothetical protein